MSTIPIEVRAEIFALENREWCWIVTQGFRSGAVPFEVAQPVQVKDLPRFMASISVSISTWHMTIDGREVDLTRKPL